MTETKPTRRPRHRRVTEDKRPPMVLTARDREIIRAVNDYRVMLQDHVQALFFQSRSTAQFRLQRLFQHEFLERHFISVVSGGPASSPAVYTLGKRGAAVLVDSFGLDRSDIRLPKGRFSWQFIEHVLTINDVRVAITLATQANGWLLEEWQDETVFRAKPDYVSLTDKRGTSRQKPVLPLPDGYFCLATPSGRSRFFLEVDKGTEELSKFRPQIRVYQAYTASGQYQERYQAKSLRVLIVAPTPRRLANLKAATRQAGGDRKYWFTTVAAISPDTVLTAPIWQTLESEMLLPLIAPA
jgi:hypothetical protein